MRSPLKIGSFIAISVLLAAGYSSVHAQNTQMGFPTFGSFQPGGFDSVNLQSLNVNFSIPIVNIPGRGMDFNYALIYNSLMWFNGGGAWQPGAGFDPWGWSNSYTSGAPTYQTYTETCRWQDPDTGFVNWEYAYEYYGWAFVDPQGTSHPLNSIDYWSNTTDCGNEGTVGPSGQATFADDNSGLYFDPATNMVTYKGGVSANRGQFTDRNGNQITLGLSSTDTVNHTALQIVHNSGNDQYKYYDNSGTLQTVTVQFSSYSVRTNFGCSGVVEYTGTASLISQIQLPNSQSYSITYEPTRGYSGYVTGRIQRVTLPTGGYYEYDYSSTNDGISCTDGTVVSMNRVINDGSTSNTWQYARSGVSGLSGTTTVTAPTMPYDSTGNQCVYTFDSNGMQSSRKDYQGNSTLLRTVNTTNSGGVPTAQTTILADTNEQSEVAVTYNTMGDVTQTNEYDWGSGSPGALVRTTVNSYSYVGLVGNVPTLTESLVKDGSGTVRFRTDYAYDGSTPICITGVADHDDTNFGCSFNSRGNMTSVTTYTDSTTPAGGATKSFTYDIFGNSRTAQLNCCQLKTFNYSSTTNYSYPDSMVRGSSSPTLTDSAAYNGYTGQIVTSTDENGQQTSYSYDSLKRLTTVTRPDSVSLTTSYNDSAVTVTQSVPIDSSNTLKTVTTYDGLGRPIAAATQDGSSTTYSVVQTMYDPVGRAFKTSNPNTGSPAYWTESDFDGMGRLIKTKLPDTTQSSISYSGNCATASDPASRDRKSCSDGLGRMTKVFENPSSLNYETDYSYNALDALTQVSQGSQTRTYVYDGMGRLTSATTPEAGTWYFAYNSFNLLTQRTDARGVITTYSYDSLNRPYQISYNVGSTGIPNSGTITYSYGTSSSSNNNGRLTQMSDGSGSESYAYNLLGEITRMQKVISGTTYTTGYTYNSAGELLQITYPSGRTVAQNYDAIGRLCSITGGSTGCLPSSYFASSFGYTTAQQASSFTYGNGVTASFGYSADRLQLSSLSYTKSGTTLFGLNYGYASGQGNNGQITNISDSVDSGRSSSYSYDALARLSAANTNGSSGYPGWGLSFSYDRYGNRTAQTVTAGSAPANSVGVDATTNHLQYSPYIYDANGNLTYDGANWITYDAENHVVWSVAPTYVVDGNGLRVQKTSSSGGTSYVYSGGKVIAEYDTNSSGFTALSREYVYSGGTMLAHLAAVSVRFTNDSCSACGGSPNNDGDRNLFVNSITIGSTMISPSDSSVSYTNSPCNGPGGIYCSGDLVTVSPAIASGQTLTVNAYGSRDYSIYPHMQVLVDGVVVGEWDVTGTAQNYSITIPASAVQYFLADHLSPRVTTDSNGNVIGQQGHFPFGESWYAASTTTKYQFTSYERDSESGNDYAQARYHINRLGRFNSPDLIAGDVGDPQSLNRYSYVRNMPVSFEDPSGMVKCAIAENGRTESNRLGVGGGPSADNDSVEELAPQGGCGGGGSALNCTSYDVDIPCELIFGGSSSTDSVDVTESIYSAKYVGSPDDHGHFELDLETVLADQAYLLALKSLTNALQGINQWSLESAGGTLLSEQCQKDLGALHVTPGMLAAGAQNAVVLNGIGSNVPLSSLYTTAPNPALRSNASTIKGTVGDSMVPKKSPHGYTVAVVDSALGANTMFINPMYINPNDSSGNLALMAHELVHNVTGLTDPDIQRALNLPENQASSNISVKLNRDCF